MHEFGKRTGARTKFISRAKFQFHLQAADTYFKVARPVCLPSCLPYQVGPCLLVH